MEQIELKWHKIMNLDELIDNEKEIKWKSGIYVWGWLDKEKCFVPYYLGKTYNLCQRLFEHLGCLKGGMYSIYSKEYATRRDFQAFKTEIKNRREPIYFPSTIANWQTNFNSKEVQESLTWLLGNLQFSWCITNKENNTDLERYIHGLLSSTKKVGASVKGVSKVQMNVTFSREEKLVNLCKQH